MPWMPNQGALAAGQMQPIAGIGQNILLKVYQKFTLYKVSLMEQIPMSQPMVVDFGAIAANSTLQAQSLQTPLQMNGNEVGQFRMKFLDDLQMQVYEPQSQPRFAITNAWARWSNKGQKVDPYDQNTEWFVWQDVWPYADVINPRAYAITQARVAFYGFRYQIARLKNPQTNQAYEPFNFIEQVPQNIPYAAALGEGFVGFAFERSGLN